jgi:hypothetical protein
MKRPALELQQPVIGCPLFCVAKDIIGYGNSPESLHRLRIVGMAIRMIRLGRLTEGVFKALGIVVRTGAEHIVKRFHNQIRS